jgi:hypothetical protein
MKPKYQLKVKIKVSKIVNDLKEELKDLPVAELAEMKVNPELIRYVCNIVEGQIKKKYKCNKKDIVTSILLKLNPALTEADKNGDIVAVYAAKYVGKLLVRLLKLTVGVVL